MATSIDIATSDANPRHRPNTAGYELAPRENEIEYRVKVGKLIATKLDGYRPGLDYILKALPEGYQLWQKHRKETPSAKAHIDRYVYGHPTGYIFRSTNEFAPHALWLARGKDGKCTCVGCTGKRTKKSLIKPDNTARTAASTSKEIAPTSGTQARALREKIDPRAPLKESVFTTLLTRLRREVEMDVMIHEIDNLAFRIEHKNFVQAIPQIVQQGAFIPRSGEIVLFHLSSPSGPAQEDDVEWKAGLITETPHPDTLPIRVSELSGHDVGKKSGLGLNYSGFRVETMTDPNSHRKDEQLQWKYLPLSCIRPFALYGTLLDADDQSKWDKSIRNALKSMATFSLALPLKFVGKWPDAWILHGGVYLGAEMLVVGDAVVVATPASQDKGKAKQREAEGQQQQDVLVISAVVLSFKNLEADPPYHSRVTGDYCSGIDVRLHGQLYRSVANPAHNPHPESLPPSLHSHHHRAFTLVNPSAAESIHSVPLTHIIGRLHEPNALAHYFPHQQAPHVLPNSETVPAVQKARAYARQHDERILALKRHFNPNNADNDNLNVGLTHDDEGQGPFAAAATDEDVTGVGGQHLTTARSRPKGKDEKDGEGGNAGVQWFWGNDRVEALGLNTFGEMDVGEEWENFLGKERSKYEG